MTPTVSPAKLTANPAVLPLKKRVTGFSSFPPFCRIDLVRAKSVALRTATVVKRARFSVSKNLCSDGASGRGLEAIGERSIAPVVLRVEPVGAELFASELSGPSLRSTREVPCAKAGTDRSTRKIRPLVLRQSTAEKNLIRVNGGALIFPVRFARPAAAIRQPMGHHMATIVYCPRVSDLRSFVKIAVETLCANYCRSREFWRAALRHGISPEARNYCKTYSEAAHSSGFRLRAATCKNHGIVACAWFE
jgi:hypothetical protein